MKVIILPGWQHNSEHWTKVSELLNQLEVNHEIIDLPGFGKEAFQKEIVNIEHVTDWLEKKLSRDEYSEIILVGHSYGGRVAASFASREPAKLKKVILIGSPNLYHIDKKTKFKKFISKLLLPFKSLLPEKLKEKFRSADYKKVHGTQLENLFKNIIGENQSTLLGKIKVPTLLIWGENDTSVPISVAFGIKKIIKNCELEILSGVRHNIHLEKPQLLVAKIIKYAKST